MARLQFITIGYLLKNNTKHPYYFFKEFEINEFSETFFAEISDSFDYELHGYNVFLLGDGDIISATYQLYKETEQLTDEIILLSYNVLFAPDYIMLPQAEFLTARKYIKIIYKLYYRTGGR